MKKHDDKEFAPLVKRNSTGLRDAIFDEIDAVRNGISNPTRANAIAKLASGIVETVRMELEVARHSQGYIGVDGPVSAKPTVSPLQLGKDA